MPKVSVVIASYQHAKFVRQSIESVLDQSFSDFEIVITDDGSMDQTADIVRSIGDPRIKLQVFPENLGACVAMNNAIERATGDYIAVLNSDDYFLPGKLKRQVRVLDDRKDLAAVFGLPIIVDERGALLPEHPLNGVFKPKTQSRHQWLRQFFFHGNSLCHPTLMIRRQCYAELGPYDPRLAQLPDFDMWIRLSSRYEFDVLGERMTAFRVLDNEANQSGSRPDVHARAMWEFSRLLVSFKRLSDIDFAATFAGDIEVSGYLGLTRDVILARLAINAAHPCHQAFGLDLLYDAIGSQLPGISSKELSQLARSLDPFNVQAHFRERELEHTIKAMRLQFDAVYSSTSWRGTRALRVLSLASQMARLAGTRLASPRKFLRGVGVAARTLKSGGPRALTTQLENLTKNLDARN